MLGTVEKGKIIDENENAYYVQIDGITYELKKQEITQDDIPKVGDEIEGFIYDNKHHDREMTQFLPFAQPDQYGWGKVTEVRPGLGVFVDVGLPDKDVVLSMDDLPREKERWPRRDDAARGRRRRPCGYTSCRPRSRGRRPRAGRPSDGVRRGRRKWRAGVSWPARECGDRPA